MPRLLALLLSVLFAVTLHAADASLSITIHHGDALLEDAVISLTPLDFAPPALKSDEAIIAQQDKEYTPYVTALRVGTEARFPNRDNVQHHLYSVSKPKRFEKPLYASGQSESVLFDQPGIVTLGCNIHDWMIAYVVVLETPWFAKTGADGLAALHGMTPGRYRLDVWHPRLGKPESREITLTAGGNPPQDFVLKLKPDRRIRRAPTGRSNGY